MVDNTHNQYGVAPDDGLLNGPVITGAQPAIKQSSFGAGALTGLEEIRRRGSSNLQARDSSGYWLASTTHGEMPFLDDSSYVFFRNVKEYGAVGDGVADDTAAINRAITNGNRCGLPTNCTSTTTMGALVYFPPGTYRVTTPIIQYYYTQFVGDPLDRPVIKGDSNFSGIALVDTDVYIPGGNGLEWYINQNQFYRQIRNIIFDLTEMPNEITSGDQSYVPTGLHWQVAQGTSLMNLDFVMPLGGGTKAVGIFMENGSGGFISDLYFYGGNIGFKAGSQQFTHRALKFQSCVTAISMIWDWGMTWQAIEALATYTALDTTAYKGSSGQGTGSIAVVDSYFEHVPYAITMQMNKVSPNILLDNLRTVDCESIVMNSGGNTLLAGKSSGEVVVDSWGLGNWVTSLNGSVSFNYGYLSPKVNKSESLLDPKGSYYARSRPQYESGFTIVNARDLGIKGDGYTDQTDKINNLLASNVGSVVFFPAGVYLVTDTVKIPVGSRIVGEGWSQIMGTGSKFSNEASPRVMVQAGKEGDSGIMEISDMLFTVRGPAAGAVLLEWNVHESTQGSAAMWDSHFRVGGAKGSDLSIDDCPRLDGVNDKCMAANLLMHVTRHASGYFENVWAWVADHDLDADLNADETTSTATQISVYAGRAILVESQGPCWFVGSSSEHSVLYQYQLSEANDIYMGHIQTETPYYQPSPTALQPFTIGIFNQDPDFGSCIANSSCIEAWAARFINSTNVYVYSAGLYSWFTNYDQDACLDSEDCQENLVDISYSQGLWFYNFFTKGAVHPFTPEGGISHVSQVDTQSGFTTQINAYLAFALTGAEIGGLDNVKGDSHTPANVSIVSLPCTSVAASSTFTMSAACTAGILQLPTSGPNASMHNDPPGTPKTCHEVCDFWRLITGTCCGSDGSISNPVEIPPRCDHSV
ncbi:hypothetical protein PHISCL_01022 [Aspergillus sclerotialis]|uniref:Rhamnogalacturonase A/B/Epimerase-like pectate lyase domain-containing protein n=1 Tax=Aspergillus sclerotialis TaxID=2070753 RepID=A0A3A2ZTW2_9EURO|nr:hypothetical protein PHISCL_01022 [Aspergillus sclerotialis]